MLKLHSQLHAAPSPAKQLASITRLCTRLVIRLGDLQQVTKHEAHRLSN